jgi:hypothetical protein
MLLALPEPQVHLVGLSIGGCRSVVRCDRPVDRRERPLAAEVLPGRLRKLDGQ